MLQTIERTIVDHDLFGPATPVVLMVSGGSDSTALAYLMTELHERGQVGPLAQHLYDDLYGMQSGKIEDYMGWTYTLDIVVD